MDALPLSVSVGDRFEVGDLFVLGKYAQLNFVREEVEEGGLLAKEVIRARQP